MIEYPDCDASDYDIGECWYGRNTDRLNEYEKSYEVVDSDTGDAFKLCDVCIGNAGGIEGRCAICKKYMYGSWIVLQEKKICKRCISEDDFRNYLFELCGEDHDFLVIRKDSYEGENPWPEEEFAFDDLPMTLFNLNLPDDPYLYTKKSKEKISKIIEELAEKVRKEKEKKGLKKKKEKERLFQEKVKVFQSVLKVTPTCAKNLAGKVDVSAELPKLKKNPRSELQIWLAQEIERKARK